MHADPCQDPESFLPSSNLKVTRRRSCWPSAHLRGESCREFGLVGFKEKGGKEIHRFICLLTFLPNIFPHLFAGYRKLHYHFWTARHENNKHGG